ncbi:hypothetical protein PT286_04465 [Neisseriaceae bacterium ESL0693]|nr:hypothetical protein [Neisseriaceae bacterium ESL0693]
MLAIELALTLDKTATAISFSGFEQLCADKDAANVLARLFYKTRMVENGKPERMGWFYLSADEFSMANISRRIYEKSRNILIELGVVQYRRAGVFGRMWWKLNIDQLHRLLCRQKGIEPTTQDNFHRDRDGFLLPKFIPLELWHEYLDTRRSKTGQAPTKPLKRKWVRQIEKLQKQGADIIVTMTAAIEGGWKNFFFRDANWSSQHNDGRKPTVTNPPVSPEVKPPDKQEEPISKAEAMKHRDNVLRMIGQLK